MTNDPADKEIEEFFERLKVEHQYYSVKLKQPVLLIGEKHLYEAVKDTIEKASNSNSSKTNSKHQFKQLPSFNNSKFLLKP